MQTGRIVALGSRSRGSPSSFSLVPAAIESGMYSTFAPRGQLSTLGWDVLLAELQDGFFQGVPNWSKQPQLASTLPDQQPQPQADSLQSAHCSDRAEEGGSSDTISLPWLSHTDLLSDEQRYFEVEVLLSVALRLSAFSGYVGGLRLGIPCPLSLLHSLGRNCFFIPVPPTLLLRFCRYVLHLCRHLSLIRYKNQLVQSPPMPFLQRFSDLFIRSVIHCNYLCDRFSASSRRWIEAE